MHKKRARAKGDRKKQREKMKEINARAHDSYRQCLHMGKLTTKKILSSMTDANTKNMAYVIRHVIPIPRFNLNLLHASETYKTNNVENNDTEL